MATPAPTYGFAKNQNRAAMNAKSTQDNENHGENTLLVSDDFVPEYKLYIYNISEEAYIRRLPPNFPMVLIPARLPDEKFAFTTMPAVVRNRFNKPQSFEYYYQIEDGRKSASQLLNPACFPGVAFERQLVPNNPAMDEQSGNNLNELGVFWSQTRPQDTEQLDKEIAIFRAILTKKMKQLAETARAWGTDPKMVSRITPRMHRAMDYLGLKAPWHTDTYAIINCGTCGEEVRQGIVYHRNSMGDRCIVDLERAQKMGIAPGPEIIGKPVALAPAVTSTEAFPVTELGPEEDSEELTRENEDEILAAAKAIIANRQKQAVEKRKQTVEAKKKTLDADPTVNSPDVSKAAETAPMLPPKPGSEGF